MSEVTVYGKPGCRACMSTTRQFKKGGVEFNYVDFTQDPEAEAFLHGEGVKSAPYVVSPVGSWSGLDEYMINELIATGRDNTSASERASSPCSI